MLYEHVMFTRLNLLHKVLSSFFRFWHQLVPKVNSETMVDVANENFIVILTFIKDLCKIGYLLIVLEQSMCGMNSIYCGVCLCCTLALEKTPGLWGCKSFRVFPVHAENETWQIIFEALIWTSEVEGLVCRANCLGARKAGACNLARLCRCLHITRYAVRLSRDHLNCVTLALSNTLKLYFPRLISINRR